MSFIAEFELDTPIMREALSTVPKMVLQIEDLHLPRNGSAKIVFWTDNGDFKQFELALQSDPTTKDYTLLTKINDRRLYRVTLTDRGENMLSYPIWAAYDIVFLDSTITHNGAQIRAQIPTRKALQEYREACQELGVRFLLRSLYREEADNPTDRFGLTPAQRDVLVRAHDQGYFNAPRGITLEGLAEEFEVTASALGRRMRRAQNTLIDQTLRTEIE